MTDPNEGSVPLKQYKASTSSSKNAYSAAKDFLPDGIGGSAPPHDPYPIFISSANGGTVEDIDGNSYIDFNLSWGVLAVGHQHPDIMEALTNQLAKGTMYGLPHEETRDVAEALQSRFPIDSIRFTNSGSESTLYATRLARRFTGKNKIVKIEGGYHGVSDSLHISKSPSVEKAGHPKDPTPVPYGEGIPDAVVEDTLVVPFNDLDAMEATLQENMGEVAAIIVEPVMMNAGVVPPNSEYLSGLREIANEYNVLLIFDETKTGVKIAPGGAADYYSVEPDMITLAKAIGGGLPLGAVGGDEKILSEIGDEGLFGTFSANPLSIRAAKVTLEDILTEDAYAVFDDFGSELFDGYRDIINDHDIPATVQAVNGTGGPIFTDSEVENYRDWATVDTELFHEYWLRMINKGIIATGYGAEEEATICVQHTERDIEDHLESFKSVAPEL